MILKIDKTTTTNQHFAIFSAHHENFVECATIKEIQFENTSRNKNLLTKILMNEVMLRVMEESEFDNTDMSNLKFFSHFGTQDSYAKIKIYHFFNILSSSDKEVLLELLKEEYKLVVAKKIEIENLETEIDNILGNFGQSRIKRKKYSHQGLGGSLVVGASPKNKKKRAVIFQTKPRCFTDSTNI